MTAFGDIMDPRLRGAVRALYLGAAALFLVTILLGIANAFMDAIPRGQVLAHFHSGTIGWVTLSVIATALWAFLGHRLLGDRETLLVRAVVATGIVAVAGYVAAFYLVFPDMRNAWLLPLFGIPAALVIWTALGITWANLKRVEVLTTPHVLLFSALLVASLGALMGVVIGLLHSGVIPRVPAEDPVGAHAGPMDMYLALAFAAVVEGLVRPGAGRWSRPGMAQAALGVAGGFVASIGFFFNVGPAAPIALLLFLVAFGFYIVRVGWRPIVAGWVDTPGRSWGALFFPVYVIAFIALVAMYYSQSKFPPHAIGVAFVHVTFIGVATNLLFTIQGHFSGGPSQAARIGIWTMNIGLLAFVAGELAAEVKHGALLMAVGVLMAWGSITVRLARMGRDSATA